MDNKRLGIILIILAIGLGITLSIFRSQYISSETSRVISIDKGVCVHEGETCPFEEINKLNTPTYVGLALILLLIGLGIYLLFFEKSQKLMKENQERIVKTLQQTRKKEDKGEKFKAILSALNEDEQKVLKAIKEQNGITQATLRIRLDMSKAKLSMILSSLEKRNLVKKVAEGKTNKVYLKIPF